MTKTTKNTLISIAVVSSIVLVSVILLMLFNFILPPYKGGAEFDKNLLHKICPADSYTAFTDEELKAMGADRAAFNAGLSNSSVLKVTRANGGVNNGKFIIHASGVGYAGGAVTLYVAYNADNTVMAVIDEFVDKSSNNFWQSSVEGGLPQIFEKLKGSSGDVGTGTELAAGTGATGTVSVNGIARAVTAANAYILRLGGAVPKEPSKVTDTALIQKLQTITAAGKDFMEYPYTPSGIKAVYVSNSMDLILRATGDYGTWGSADLLVLVDRQAKTVLKVNYMALGATNYENVNTEQFKNAAKLTALFENKTLAEVEAMRSPLDGVTGATETGNGLLVAVKNALKNIDGFLAEWGGEIFPSDVTGKKLADLRALTSEGLTFQRYPFAVENAVSSAYISNEQDVIFEVQGSGGGDGYGETKLYVHVDTAAKTVIKIKGISFTAQDFDGIVSEVLTKDPKLNTLFAGKNAADIDGMPKYLNGSTGATETSRGLKNAVKNALVYIDDFLHAWGEIGGLHE